VVAQARRGFAADIFSLGCVYAESAAAISHTQKLQQIRLENPNGDLSYQAYLAAVGELVAGICSRLRFSGHFFGRVARGV
jgi:hypothetical protein